MSQLDELIGNKDAFPILGKWDFFNHAGVSPLPKVSADQFRIFATQIESAAYLDSGWHPLIEKLRVASASILNCHRDEVAFVKNTGEGLSIVSRGLAWNAGDRIITTGVEYPTNMYPWMDVAAHHGAEVVMVSEEDGPEGSRHVPIEKILEVASHPRTRLIALSHVEFASGQRHDLEAIGSFCRDRGIFLCVDAIQSMGVMPIDVQAMKIDFLSADGHKWMLGPEAAGIFYCRRELLPQVRPLSIGATSVTNSMNLGSYSYTLRPDAGRFECGSLNVPGLLALKSSMEMLQSIGIEQVSLRLKSLTDFLIAGLAKKGYRHISPRTDSQWSGILSFVTLKHDPAQIVKDLRANHKIELSLRVGRLRCSAHFYNTEAQLEKLLDCLPAH